MEQGKKRGKPSRYFVIGTLCALIVLLILQCVLVVAVDPFQRYRIAESYPFRLDKRYYVMPGLVANSDYNAIVIGSSMVEHTKVSQIDRLFGLNTIKIASQGGSALDHSLTLRLALKGRELERVFYGLDAYAYTDKGEKPSDAIPEYLWNDNFFDDIPYWLNLDVLTQEIKYALEQMRNPDATPIPRDEWFAWEASTVYSREQVLSRFGFTKGAAQLDPAEGLANAQHNFESYLAPFLQENPEVQFTFYFPPYSQLYWVLLWQEGILEEQLAVRAWLTEQLLAYSNVDLYDFSAQADWIEDLDRYTDYSHHDPAMSEAIFDRIAAGENRVTETGQIEEHNAYLRESAKAFAPE